MVIVVFRNLITSLTLGMRCEVESRMSIPEISLAVKPGDLAAEKMVGMENVRPPEVATEE